MQQKRGSMLPTLIVGFLAVGVLAMIAMTQQAVTTIQNPAVEIISFGESAKAVGRFDTSTGEIRSFTGDPDYTGAHGVWASEVKGVASAGNPAGTFRLQHPFSSQGLFLVNVQTGETWVLREPREHSWYWDPVPLGR